MLRCSTTSSHQRLFGSHPRLGIRKTRHQSIKGAGKKKKAKIFTTGSLETRAENLMACDWVFVPQKCINLTCSAAARDSRSQHCCKCFDVRLRGFLGQVTAASPGQRQRLRLCHFASFGTLSRYVWTSQSCCVQDVSGRSGPFPLEGQRESDSPDMC